MRLEITLSDGTKLIENDQVGFWRKEVLAPCKATGRKIISVIVDGQPFYPNADGYFMLFNKVAFVHTGQTVSDAKGIGYVKYDTERAKVLWHYPNGEVQAEVYKPIPEFIYEIMVERDKSSSE